MNTSDTLTLLARGISIIVAVIIIAALHFGQEIFVPLVLAGLFCFLLSPVVNRLERWRLGRIPSVLLTTAFAFALVAALAYVVAGQVLDLGNKLPSYHDNIRAKIASFQVPQDGTWGRVTKTFDDLRGEMVKKEANKQKGGSNVAEPVGQPMPVEVVNTSGGQITEIIRSAAGPILGPIGTGFIVIVFVIFMLLKKEDLRNRVIHLVGRSRLSLTTRTIEEAGNRVSRYLLMQVIVNVSYAIPIGIGLMILGVPNALLWGALTAVLRFVPYLGAWIGAFFPMVLSLAVSNSWSTPILTLSLFLVVELISNNVLEPWLYGSSTGLSPVAILVAAIFWTWMWGPVGLLLSTPLTVCLAVLGKHVPALSFLDIILGDEPSLSAPDRYYQRLLAHDELEATKVLAEYEKTTSFDRVLVDLLAPAVMSAEGEFEDGTLGKELYSFVLATVRKHALREALRTAPVEPFDGPPDVLIVPAEDEGDEVVGVILGELLGSKIRTQVTSYQVLTNEKADFILKSGAPVVCISDTSRNDAPRARFLGRRLRTLQNTAFVVTGLWTLDDEESNLATLAERFSADQAATNLLVARDALRGWVVQPSVLNAAPVAKPLPA